ncbi:MAG: hypothetical protein NTZ09_14375 [Candidatus Hydrogenedentes bacterium]|nr:hypothetical protein [Candidatus Hydrogenedentota bacterium]
MYRLLAAAMVCALLCSCEGTMDKVMADFGLKARPEGYVSGSDKVMEQLDGVGATEMKRMNMAEQRGTVKFQKESEVRGKYYKEVKKYERYVPTDAQAVNRAALSDTGYAGYLDYTYRIYQSERKPTSAEAAAESATIPTDVTGHETYRYTFSSAGQWNGSKGERARN